MSSSAEKDLNPNTYIGMALPLNAGNNLDFKLTKTSLEQAQHNLRNLLLTNKGERIAQPEFGSNLRSICFEPDNEDLPTKIEDEVKKTTETWLPYIQIRNVETLTTEIDTNKIIVKVTYSTVLNPNTLKAITIDAGYTADRTY